MSSGHKSPGFAKIVEPLKPNPGKQDKQEETTKSSTAVQFVPKLISDNTSHLSSE